MALNDGQVKAKSLKTLGFRVSNTLTVAKFETKALDAMTKNFEEFFCRSVLDFARTALCAT
jgi:hypothetical protein